MSEDDKQREFRKIYRLLQEKVGCNEQRILNDPEFWQSVLTELEHLYSRSSGTAVESLPCAMGNLTLDADILNKLLASVRKARVHHEALSHNDFADKLTTSVGGIVLEKGSTVMQTDHWATLGDKVAPIFSDCSALHFVMGSLPKLKGSFTMASSQKVSSRKRDFLDIGQTKLTSHSPGIYSDKTDEQRIQLEKMFEALTKEFGKMGKGLTLFHLCLDPTSFTKTLNNLFVASFLVKDGLALLEITDEIPYIRPANRTEADLSLSTNTGQSLINLTFDDWKELKDLLEISEPAIRFDEF